ncbi:MAG: hypothetical protein C4523_05370 [Myxococcales bacterium]|nr:MAG: hypothetical protein C4523_05370 [Myxococcales bacterium]
MTRVSRKMKEQAKLNPRRQKRRDTQPPKSKWAGFHQEISDKASEGKTVLRLHFAVNPEDNRVEKMP